MARAAFVATPTRRAKEEWTGGVMRLASVAWRVGLVWRGSAVPVSMRSLGTDRSLVEFPPASRLYDRIRSLIDGEDLTIHEQRRLLSELGKSVCCDDPAMNVHNDL